MEQDAEKTRVSGGEAEATQIVAGVDCPVCHTSNPPSETYCIDCGFLLGSTPGEFETAQAEQIGAWLVEVSSGREFPIRLGANSIGRQNADILLTDPSVSRSHAVIHAEEGNYYVEDLGSTNGTIVDGRLIARGERVRLQDGAELKFGSVTMRLQAPSLAAAVQEQSGAQAEQEAEVVSEEEPAKSAKQEQEPAAAEAETVERPAVGRLVSADGSSLEVRQGRNSVGRAGSNDIVIADPYTSGRHAEIVVEGEEITLTDLGSTNGTLVDGSLIEKGSPVSIRPGARIQFGKAEFTFELLSTEGQ